MSLPALVVVPLLLAVVLAVSAVAKLRERASTLTAVRLLRLPAVLQHPALPVVLPVAELLLAAAMLAPWQPLVNLAAAAALVLLVTYWVVIARAMRFTPRPDCGCFGRIGNQTVSGQTLARNTVLLLLAVGFAAWAWTGHTAWQALAAFDRGDWLWSLLLVVAAALAVLIVLRSEARPLFGQQTPATPAPASATEADEYVRAVIPRASLQSPAGDPVLLRELAVARAQLLMFTTCGCGSTARGLERLPAWRDRLPALDVRAVATDRRPAPVEGQPEVWYDHGGVAYAALGLEGTPVAVLLGADGLIAGGPVVGLDAIEEFVDDIEAALREAAPPPGEDVPDPGAPAVAEVPATAAAQPLPDSR